MQKFAALIGWINGWMGKILSYLLVLMLVTICYEVVARYFFNRPTMWCLELNTYTLCIYALLGGGFTLLRNGHVSVDILYGRFGFRTQAIVSCFTSFFFFIFVLILIWFGYKMTYESIAYHETSGTILDWPLSPTKIMVPIGAVLLLLQGVVKFMNDLVTALTGKEPAGGKTGGFLSLSKAK